MNILVSGSSGLVGGRLLPLLRASGHTVTRLVRREPRSPDERHWDPAHGSLDPAVFEGVRCVINLAGDNIGKGRWTAAKKQRILDSRVETTGLLARTMASLAEKPEVFADGVPALVRIAGRSPEHVARTCTRCLGRTPTQIIEAARIHWAERQLRVTSETVTNLALACGYSTTAQFYRSFRKRYGQPPSRYRRWLNGTRSSQ